jgi:hypothetical protein
MDNVCICYHNNTLASANTAQSTPSIHFPNKNHHLLTDFASYHYQSVTVDAAKITHMSVNKITFPLLRLMLLFLTTLWFNLPLTAQWIRSQTPSHIQDNLWEIQKDTGSTLITVGNKGRILYSLDSGFQWIESPFPGFEHLRNVCFNHDNTAFICGGNGLILSSKSVKGPWSVRHTSNQLYLNTICVRQHMGVAAGRNGALLTSQDSGKSWNTTPSKTHHTFYSSCPVSDELLVLGADSGFLFLWNTLKQELTPLTSPYPLNINSIGFLQPHILFTAGGKPDTSGLGLHENFLAVSYDTGKSWEVSHFPSARQFNKACFLSRDTVFFTQPSGRIANTLSGVHQFGHHYIGTPLNLNGIYFFTPKLGVLCADMGQIYTTRNMGGFGLHDPITPSPISSLFTIENPVNKGVFNTFSPYKGSGLLWNMSGNIVQSFSVNMGVTPVEHDLPNGIYYYRFVPQFVEGVPVFGKLIVQNR